MTSVEVTLLIIIAAGFAILLLLSIVAVVIIVQILRNIHHITEKAEATTDNLAETLKVLGKKLAPVAITSLVSSIISRIKKRHNSKEDK